MKAYRANVQVHIRSQVVVDCGLLAGDIAASHNHESASAIMHIVKDLIDHSSQGCNFHRVKIVRFSVNSRRASYIGL